MKNNYKTKLCGYGVGKCTLGHPAQRQRWNSDLTAPNTFKAHEYVFNSGKTYLGP